MMNELKALTEYHNFFRKISCTCTSRHAVRNENKYEDVPIIAVTANVLVGDRERCIEAGCNEYLPKPLDIRQLRTLMRDFL